MRTSSRIAINVVTHWLTNGLQSVIGFLLVPFLLRHLGREGYGLIALVGVIITSTNLLDMGLRQAVGRQLAAEVARKDVRRFNELASTALALFFSLGLLCALLCIACAPLLAGAFAVSAALKPQAVFLIRWYGSVSILLSFCTSVFGATVTATNRFDLLNLRSAVFGLLTGAAYFLVLSSTQSGIYGWAAVSMSGSILTTLVVCQMAYRVYPALHLRWRHVKRAAVGSLFSIGGYMYAVQLTNYLSVQSDPLVLSSFLGPASVALYTPGGSLAAHSRPLVTALSGQLHPVTTALYITGKTAELQSALIRGTRYTLLLGIPVCVAMGVFAMPLTRLWLEGPLGADYRISGAVMMCWAIADLFTYGGGGQWPILLGMRRLKFWLWTQLPAGIVNILLSIALVGYTRLGVLGVMVATVAISIIRRPILTIHTAHVCGLSARKYFAESYARPLVVLGALGVIALLLQRFWCPDTWSQLLACLSLVALSWAPLCWGIGLDAADRKSFMRILNAALLKCGLRSPPSHL